MNYEEANVREAKMLLWWSKGALVASCTLRDTMITLVRNRNRGKMNSFTEGCITRRKVLEKGMTRCQK